MFSKVQKIGIIDCTVDAILLRKLKFSKDFVTESKSDLPFEEYSIDFC